MRLNWVKMDFRSEFEEALQKFADNPGLPKKGVMNVTMEINQLKSIIEELKDELRQKQ